MKTGLPRFLEQLHQVDAGLNDGQLLTRFWKARDEGSFATLVRRHGPMVLSVCRRVLGNFHDAEDAFQATFLVLAARAASVLHQESVACWLYTVAYHTAVDAARANARRHAREKPMREMPHPEAARTEVVDWRPLLDRELQRLSEKYRRALVLCDLQGLPQKEAARVLGIPPGTVSSRLIRARALLAKRLAARGLVLAGGALAAVLMTERALAQVPTVLVHSTARVAALVAAGQWTAAAGPAVVLMKGVMHAMWVKRLKVVVGSVMVAVVLSALGLVWRPGIEARAQPGPSANQAGDRAANRPADRPRTEMEELRRENEDLRATVRILVREISTLEKRLGESNGKPASEDARPGKALNNSRPQPAGEPQSFDRVPPVSRPGTTWDPSSPPASSYRPSGPSVPGSEAVDPNEVPAKPGSKGADVRTPPSAEQEMEGALRQLRNAHDAAERERAIEALERATRKLREQANPGSIRRS